MEGLEETKDTVDSLIVRKMDRGGGELVNASWITGFRVNKDAIFRLVEVKTGRLTINIVKFRPSSGPGFGSPHLKLLSLT